jgi:glycosyltransferase involved in cell wall biosynthesis
MSIQKIFIAHSWNDVGVNIQTKAVAKKLSESIQVLYLTQSRTGNSKLRVNDNLVVAEWPNKRPNTIKDFFFICKKIIRERPDIFIAHFGATNISMIAAWLLRIKYRVCWLHTMAVQFYFDVEDKTTAEKIIKRKKRIYSLATHVIVLNEYGRKDAIKYYSIPGKKIYKIYNGIHSAGFKKVNSGIVKSIRFIGRLDNSKGVDILIKAFAKVYTENKNLLLEIAGKGSEEENLKTITKGERLEDAVKFHGYFNHYAEAEKFISEAYCLVVPSRIDNFPNVILEALSAGVPVIASNAGGVPDMIEDEMEGYLVENENIEAFSAAIKKMTGNPEIRNKMALKARKSYEEKFTLEKHVSNVTGFLNSLKQGCLK